MSSSLASRLSLPFAPGHAWKITNLFNDPGTLDLYRSDDPSDKVKLHGHEGIDWGCYAGTPIHAMAPGYVMRVRTTSWSKGGGQSDPHLYGNFVAIWTWQGPGREYELTYAHLATVRVQVGQTVARGDVIGVSGNTGNSTGPHLHVRYRPAGYRYGNGFTGGEDFRAYLDTDIYDWTFIAGLLERTDTHTLAEKIIINAHNRTQRNDLNIAVAQPILKPPILKKKEGAQVKALVAPFDEADEVAALNAGTGYWIVGQDIAGDAPGWWRIDLPGHAVAWVPNKEKTVSVEGDTSLLLPMPEVDDDYDARPQASLLDSTTAGLIVRAGPSTAHARIGTLKGGTPVPSTRYDVLGKNTATATPTTPTWWRIVFTNDAEERASGWVHGDYVQTHGELSKVPVTPQLGRKDGVAQGDIRAHPEPTAANAGTLTVSNQGIVTYYEIVGKDAKEPEWWQIRFGHRGGVESLIGWVHKDHAQTRGDLQGVPVTGPVRLRLQPQAVVRRGPGLHQAVLPADRYAADAAYDIVGKDAAHPSWWQICIGNGTGWVQDAHADRIRGDTDDMPNREDVRLPSLILKAGTEEEPVTLHVGPDTRYHSAARGYAPRRAPDHEYPIVGRAPGWWQILYSDDWLSPLWVSDADVEDFQGNKDEVVEARPWVRVKEDETDFQGYYEAHLDENAQVQFTLTIARATQARMPGALPFEVYPGFRPKTAPPPIEVKALAVDAQGKPIPGVAATALEVSAGTDGSLRAQWKSGPPAHAHPVGYRTATAVAWAQEALTATGPQVTRNAQTALAIPGRDGPGTGHPRVPGRPAIGPTDTRCYDLLGQDAALANWFRIRGPGGTGWVDARLMSPCGPMAGVPIVSAAGMPMPIHARTKRTVDAVVRAHGDATAAEIARLARGGGTRMALTGLRRASPTWWQVQLDETRRGWVHADQLETAGDLATLRAALPYLGLKPTTRRDVTVRAGPGSAYPPVACIPVAAADVRLGEDSPAPYAILGQDAALPTWWEIRYDEATTGWVPAAVVQTQGNLSGVPVTGARPEAALAAGATEALAVRAGPGAGYAAAGAAALALGVDARYEIVGRNAAAETWWEIRYDETTRGWVPAAGVQTYGPTDGVPVTWVLQAVRGLTVTARGARGLAVAWQVPAGGPAPTGYEVAYRRADAALWTRHPRTGTGATDVLSGLEPGAAYAVRVRALGPGEPGPWREGTGAPAAGPRLQLLPTTTLGLNVRAGPDTRHGIVGGIPGGSETWYAIAGQDAPAPVWWQIRFHDVLGWVHGAYVRTAGAVDRVPVTWPALRIPGLTPRTIYETEVLPARGTARGAAQRTTATTAALPQLSLKAGVTAGLNVRSGPGTGYARVGGIAGGSTTRYEIAGKDAATAEWWQIRFRDAITGWAHAAYAQTHNDVSRVPVTWVLQAVRGLTATADGTRALTVRWQAPASGPTPTGYAVRYRRPDGRWWRSRAHAGTGTTAALPALTPGAAYVVQVQATRGAQGGPWQETRGATAATPALRLKATATRAAVVRAGPGATHTRVATLAVGSATWYAILGKDAATAGWWQIQYSATVTGWVPARSVQTRGHTDGVTVTWVLQAVRGLAATAAGLRALTVTWQAPAGGPAPTGYAVRYRRSAVTRWETHAHAGTGTTATIPALTPNAAYDVRVQATRGATGGPWAATTGTTAAAPQLQLKATTTAGLNVRSGPGTSHGRVGFIAGGSTTWYAILGKDAATAGWWQIRYSATVTGWVHADYVRTRGYTQGVLVTWVLQAVRGLAATAAGGRALTATWQAPAGGPAPTGYAVEYRVRGTSSWQAHAHTGTGTTATIPRLTPATTYDVQVQARQGATGGPWAATTGTTATVPQVSLKATTTLGLNVRSGPGTNHRRVGLIAGGSTTKYDVLGQDAATAGWWQIRYSAAVTGWVHAAYVQTHGSMSGVAVTWTLQAVRALAGAAHGARQVRVTWQAPASGPAPTGYAVQYRRSAVTRWETHAHAGAGTTATIPDLTPSAAYTVQVRATQGAVGGPWQTTTATTGAQPQLRVARTQRRGATVRAGPGTSHARVGFLGQVLGGTPPWHDILGQDAATAGWWQIRYSASVKGWVRASETETQGSLTALPVTWTLQAVRGLAVAANGATGLTARWQAPANGPTPAGYDVQYRRRGARSWSSATHTGTGAQAALSGLTARTTYDVRVRATRGTADGPWAEARGATARAATTGPQLSLKSTTTLGLNVRSGPGTSHGRVGSIAGGSTTRYALVGKNAATATWWQIQYSATVKGWVHADYVQTHGNTANVQVTWTAATPQLSLKGTTTWGLNVRAGAGTGHRILGTIAGGSTRKYAITGKNAATATWWQIQYSATVKGWVHADYVQTHGSTANVPVR